MRKPFSIIVLLALLFYRVSAYSQTEKHSIRSVSSGGEVITLDDGTSWSVSYSWDYFKTKYWYPYAEVIVIDGMKMTHIEKNETVEVKPVNHGASFSSKSSLQPIVPNNNGFNSDAFSHGVELGMRAAEAEKQRQFEERTQAQHEQAETERLKLLLNSEQRTTPPVTQIPSPPATIFQPTHRETQHGELETADDNEPSYISKLQNYVNPVLNDSAKLLTLKENIALDSAWLSKARGVSGDKLFGDWVSWSDCTPAVKAHLSHIIQNLIELDSLTDPSVKTSEK